MASVEAQLPFGEKILSQCRGQTAVQLPSPLWESGWNLPQNSPSCTGQGWGGRGPERGPETWAGPAPASLIFCGQVRPSPSLGSLEDEMGATGQQLPVGSGPTCSQGLPGGPWAGRSRESLSPGASPGKPPLATVGWAWEQLAGGEGGALHPAGVPFRNGRDPPQAQTPHQLRGACPAPLLRPTGPREAGVPGSFSRAESHPGFPQVFMCQVELVIKSTLSGRREN